MLPVLETPAAPTVDGSNVPRAMSGMVAALNVQTLGTDAVTSTVVVAAGDSQASNRSQDGGSDSLQNVAIGIHRCSKK